MRIRTVLLIAALAAAASSLIPASATAQPRIGSFGFGATFGDPLGITLKGALGGTNSWDAAIGTSWFGRLRIHADYLWAANVFNSRKAGMYFGIGGILGFGRGSGVIFKGRSGEWYYYEDENAVALGARVVAGLNFMPFTAPVEMFVEVAPVLGVIPTSGFGSELALGIRYYP